MNIFFTSSPRSLKVKSYKNNLIKIFNTLEQKGEHLSKLVIKANPKTFYQSDNNAIKKHYKETLLNLSRADIVIVENSVHSTAMGYIINKALELSKPILVLYTQGCTPSFLSGIQDLNLITSEYSFNTIEHAIDNAFDFFADKQNKRFNIMLSPDMVNFLNSLSKQTKTSKAQIIRGAIGSMM